MAEANSSIILPAPLFTDPRSLKALANGYFYVGATDTDPTSPVNQIPVYNRNEDGSLVQVSQPISIGVGGYPVLNGIPFAPIVDGNYSIAIFDSIDVQRFYFAYVSAYQPTSPSLSALSELMPAANKLPYFTGPDSAALTDLSPYARILLAITSKADFRSELDVYSKTETDTKITDAVTPVSNRIGYALLSLTNPALNTRTVTANPFGNNTPVMCLAEIFHATLQTWIVSPWFSSGTSSASIGMSAAFHTGEGIILKTGSSAFIASPPYSGSSVDVPSNYTTPSPVRIHVWKVTA